MSISKKDASLVDAPTKLFVRQILQTVMVQQLRWPSQQSLLPPHNQQYIWSNCFDTVPARPLPSVRYRLSVLKLLVERIESAIHDPDEDEIDDGLVESLSALLVEEAPTDVMEASRRSWVTYAVAGESQSQSIPPIRLLERRSVISGSGTTGLRTWEAALHLGTYLLSSSTAAADIQGKNILELGAGTGLLSILAASLGANQVVSTDGSEEVVSAIADNVDANECRDKVKPGVLRWGWTLKDSIVEETFTDLSLDTVLAADVTYDTSVIPALVATFRKLFDVWPKVKIYLAATLRNEQTYAAFVRACDDARFEMRSVVNPQLPFEDQVHLFHSTTTPIAITVIEAQDSGNIWTTP